MSQYFITDRGIYNGEGIPVNEMPQGKLFLIYRFPDQKGKIADLSLDEKMEWYAYQFQYDQQAATINLSSDEFMSFWKWRVVIPMKIKRLFYRIKNGEVFKKYPKITEIKKKLKPHTI